MVSEPIPPPGPPLDIFLASIGIPHDGLTLREQSLGGSETAAIHIAHALAARGHNVTVFSPLPERRHPNGQVTRGGEWNRVRWAPIEEFVAAACGTPHDVTIVSRDLNLLQVRNRSAIKVLWCHDLALKRARGVIGRFLWDTDALYVLSAFQKRQYQEVYGLPESVLVQTRNGLDLPTLAQYRNVKRDPLKLVYGSRPERGLEACLAIMEVLRRRGSDLRLEVSGYDAPGLGQPLQSYYQQLFQRAASMPNVVVKGPLVQAQWYEQLASAQALLYPGPPPLNQDFREISCLVAAESQALGTPVVSIARGALLETVAFGGVLLGGEETEVLGRPHIEAMADAVLSLVGDPAAWGRASACGAFLASSRGWERVAAEWEADWMARFDARTASTERLVSHYRRLGDHEAVAMLEAAA